MPAGKAAAGRATGPVVGLAAALAADRVAAMVAAVDRVAAPVARVAAPVPHPGIPTIAPTTSTARGPGDCSHACEAKATPNSRTGLRSERLVSLPPARAVRAERAMGSRVRAPRPTGMTAADAPRVNPTAALTLASRLLAHAVPGRAAAERAAVERAWLPVALAAPAEAAATARRARVDGLPGGGVVCCDRVHPVLRAASSRSSRFSPCRSCCRG